MVSEDNRPPPVRQRVIDQRQAFRAYAKFKIVAIVDLDQTSHECFDPSNAFDAEALTQLTEAIEVRRKMCNEIEQRTLVDIRTKDIASSTRGAKKEPPQKPAKGGEDDQAR